MTTAVTTTPTTTATGTAATNQANIQAGIGNLSSSYSTFLTLLTTQLQNQDPTSPLDSNAFTQQLVSMTGVQQQLLTNELLQQMVTNSTGSSVAGSTNLIGKSVTATSANATLSGGQASWGYNLPTAAAQATATISDANGVTGLVGFAQRPRRGPEQFQLERTDVHRRPADRRGDLHPGGVGGRFHRRRHHPDAVGQRHGQFPAAGQRRGRSGRRRDPGAPHRHH